MDVCCCPRRHEKQEGSLRSSSSQKLPSDRSTRQLEKCWCTTLTAPGSRCLEFTAPEYPRRLCPLLILKVWNGRFRIKGKTAKNNTRPPIHHLIKGKTARNNTRPPIHHELNRKHLRKTHSHPFIIIPWLLFVCFVFSFDCKTGALALNWMIFACAGVFLWIIICSVHRCSGCSVYTDFKGDGNKLRCNLPQPAWCISER